MDETATAASTGHARRSRHYPPGCAPERAAAPSASRRGKERNRLALRLLRAAMACRWQDRHCPKSCRYRLGSPAKTDLQSAAAPRHA